MSRQGKGVRRKQIVGVLAGAGKWGVFRRGKRGTWTIGASRHHGITASWRHGITASRHHGVTCVAPERQHLATRRPHVHKHPALSAAGGRDGVGTSGCACPSTR